VSCQIGDEGYRASHALMDQPVGRVHIAKDECMEPLYGRNSEILRELPVRFARFDLDHRPFLSRLAGRAGVLRD
jgi:hypothetical protein